MNKYQEVLNELIQLSASERQNKLYDTLQELVDKETPMKPLLKKYDMFYPSCNTLVYIDDWNAYLDRCIDCGQKIDWGKDSE